MHKAPPIGSLALILLIMPFLGGCTTVENRRDLYFPQRVWGPYTKILHKGIPKQKPQTIILPTSTSNGSGKNVIKPQG
jgi:hypothetical protein